MNELNFKEKLYEQLKKDDRLWNEEKTDLNQILLLDLVEQNDKKIIELLLDDSDIKDRFFIQINDSYVFKSKDFNFFIEENTVNNSYTSYANIIGLANNNRLLNNTKEVVLNFPYKDCVLKGDQDTGEGEDYLYEYDEKLTKTQKNKGYEENSYNLKPSKREEIFLNNVLAQDEIDRLYDDKAFINWCRYNKEGKNKVDSLNIVGENIKDNLIIKGNNLLTMHSLKPSFKNKVQLIYADIPYNTQNDEFKYNDRFNHSTWLTFIKNRLEVAKDLLKDDGLIFIHCDDNEQAYLKVLMDEVFGRSNFISTIATLTNRSGRDYGGIAQTHDYILVYSKTNNYSIYKIENTDKKFPYSDDRGVFQVRGLRNRNVRFNKENRPNLFYPFYVNPESNDQDLHEVSVTKKEDWDKVIPMKSQGIQTVWRWGKEKAKNENYDLCARKRRDGSYRIMQKYRDNTSMARSVWYDKEIRNEVGTRHIKKLFDNKVFDYPKSEFIIKKVIEIGSKENDIVLDFCLGSGTTAAVAQKMNRQYIGIEQMDYIEDITLERMKKVIEGEQGGVSEKVNWEGGGEFVYAELAKWNKKAKEEIMKCKNFKELKKLFNNIYDKYFLNYNVNVKEFKNKIMKEDKFKNLSLKKQKTMVANMLDLNQLYVQKTEIEDKKFGIDEYDQKLTKQFYMED
jgi:adenine-specific DNA-methyltransferase